MRTNIVCISVAEQRHGHIDFWKASNPGGVDAVVTAVLDFP